MGKRPDGVLEHEILTVLWAADRPLTPKDVQNGLEIELAYTTVGTVLGRLQAKGLVSRVSSGRGFGYLATVTEAQLAAKRMGDVLSSASDRDQVLAGFVGTLSAKEARALRQLLGGDA